MPGLDPGIHAFLDRCGKDVDGRVKPGHDEERGVRLMRSRQFIMAGGVAFFAPHHMMIVI